MAASPSSNKDSTPIAEIIFSINGILDCASFSAGGWDLGLTWCIWLANQKQAGGKLFHGARFLNFVEKGIDG